MSTIDEMLFCIALHQGRYSHPLSLCRYRAQMYSQFGEDGIIAEIFGRIGERDRFFLEIGTENGIHNNTRFLLEQGWRGVWVDVDFRDGRQIFDEYVASGALILIEANASADNINQLLDQHNVPAAFDFLSIDIDHNTSHLWRALDRRARAACIEYNAALPASVAAEVPYDPSICWDQTNWFGASLKMLQKIAEGKGMRLVGCELSGINAFFVDADEAPGKFQEPFTAEAHYEPPRGAAVGYFGHAVPRAARRWLRPGQK